MENAPQVITPQRVCKLLQIIYIYSNIYANITKTKAMQTCLKSSANFHGQSCTHYHTYIYKYTCTIYKRASKSIHTVTRKKYLQSHKHTHII